MNEPLPEPGQQDTRPAELRIRFGDGPTQTIPADWAETILRKLAKDRKKFGDLLRVAALGEGP